MPTIDTQLQSDLVLSNALNVLGCVFLRIAIGAVSDRLFGARDLQVAIMAISLPAMFLVCTVTTGPGVVAARFFIGLIGSTFVTTSVWVSSMFVPKIVGLANATAAGWGNAGSGVAAAVLPAIFESLRKSGYGIRLAWQITLIVPASLCLFGALITMPLADNPPKKIDPSRKESDAPLSFAEGFRKNISIPFAAAIKQPLTPFLMCAYACSFGFELIAMGQLSLHLTNTFNCSALVAGLVTGLFAGQNLTSPHPIIIDWRG